MTRWARITASLVVLLMPSLNAMGELRFPPPEFESGYQFPQTTSPAARAVIYEYIDAVVLLAALLLGTYLILRKRSRRAVYVLMISALVYFGFWRDG
ncbi:MAG: hypothetical protein EHM35_13805, partial [Planctomycetaceae bacterium]